MPHSADPVVDDELIDRLADISGRVVFVPVRHHSPGCARAIVRLMDRVRPTQVLIEGPSDFNARLAEFDLPHRLPIAIYTWVRLADGRRLGSFYPFCSYSPEWVALTTARSRGISVSFIDLPWSELAGEDPRTQQYTDGDLRRSHALANAARRFGVDGFDALWDELVEVHDDLDPLDYLRRVHRLCSELRRHEGEGDVRSQVRERFMVERIRAVMATTTGTVLVITGGFHSSALAAGLVGKTLPDPPRSPPLEISDRGLALTPYSYRRLDALTGYEAGMPGPAFYQRVWDDRQAGGVLQVERLIGDIAKRLRACKQPVSTADLIALRSTGEGLARLRGHHGIWRSDLLDAAQATLIKEDLPLRGPHPIRAEIDEVLRGGERGRLAAGAAVPPLVADLHQQLATHDLEPVEAHRQCDLELGNQDQRAASQVLHRLQVVGISGFVRSDGTDFATRSDLARPWERWRIAWTPEFEASAIEAASLGASLVEAATAALVERLAIAVGTSASNQAAAMSEIVLAGELCGLPELTARHAAGLAAAIGADGGFISVATAIGTLLHLYRFDQVLGSTGRVDLGALLVTAWERALVLLEQGGAGASGDGVLNGVRTLVATWERCGTSLGLDLQALNRVLSVLQINRHTAPMIRGGATGGRWTLGLDQAEGVLATIKGFSAPEALGDFLTGVFALAREAVQRRTDLLAAVEHLVDGWDAEEFLLAVPSMRLAFSGFPPRERHHLAATIASIISSSAEEDHGSPPAVISLLVPVFTPEESAEGLRQEEALLDAAARFGLSLARWRETVAESVLPSPGQESVELPQREPMSAATMKPIHAPDVRRLRWRLILGAGGEVGLGGCSDGTWRERDQALEFLYRREQTADRNLGPGSLGESVLTVPEWINQVHALFPKRTIERLEKDALERYHLDEMVTNPELLKRAVPNENLLRAVLHTKHLMNQEVLALARDLVRRVVAQLMEKLAQPVRQPFTGVRLRRPSSLRIARNFDARTTVRRNLANWNPATRSIIIRTPCFLSRVRRHSERWQIIALVDESGSMAANVIHAAVTAAILVGLPSIKTHLVLFDTNVVDVSDQAGDPVETIMKVQLGGGTDIGQALHYAEGLITNPRKAMVVLISDFCEGGPAALMLGSIQRMIGDGTIVLGLAALSHDAEPCYDQQMAGRMVALGAHVGAMTPGELAAWIAEKVG